MVKRSRTIGTRHPASGTIADLDDLAVFVAVAQHASFAEASRRLRIPTSSVSRAVVRIERDVGVPLLRRTSRTVVVTDEGRELLDAAAGHLDGLHEALAAIADRRAEPSGVVRVTAPAFTGATRVARALATFTRAYPKLAVELDATNAIRDLLEDGYDFGIRVGSRADADFITRHLWQGRFALFAARALVATELGGRAEITQSQLERVPCVVARTPIVWRFADPAGRAIDVTPRACFVINDPRGAVEVARSGVGVVLAPRDAVPARDRELVELATRFGEPQPVDLFVVYPSRRRLPSRVRLAIDWLASRG